MHKRLIVRNLVPRTVFLLKPIVKKILMIETDKLLYDKDKRHNFVKIYFCQNKKNRYKTLLQSMLCTSPIHTLNIHKQSYDNVAPHSLHHTHEWYMMKCMNDDA